MIIFHSSEAGKSKMKVLADSVSGEGLVPVHRHMIEMTEFSGISFKGTHPIL